MLAPLRESKQLYSKTVIWKWSNSQPNAWWWEQYTISPSHASTTQENSATSTTVINNFTPSHGGDVTVCAWHKTNLAHSFLFCSCVYFCVYGPCNCISFHKFFWQLFIFSLCSSGLVFALLVLSTTWACAKSFLYTWSIELYRSKYQKLALKWNKYQWINKGLKRYIW